MVRAVQEGRGALHLESPIPHRALSGWPPAFAAAAWV